ncbi:hypothetical protein [Streptomyces radicis]|uniref:LppX_LprAFG lipoprotein n=1 Tax=Streptomyces radicis TaxID=1750517 RepID=A0A3A9WUI1_9ACTN|nr:hypothetical protein [Streptomyces radicis]RKN09777.1 hypothetical protein D7319_12090 [Streptomyces radicis]RKN23414.1 hypothetical protein D7318_13045 [Streptomyces radicis]
MALRRRTRVNELVGALSALALLTAATGCSGTGAAAEGDAREALRGAVERLADSGSSRARTAMEMASGGTRITLSGRGGFDYGARSGELLVTLPDGEPVTELFVPGRLYMKNRGAGVPPDKWVVVDVSSLADGNLVTGGATDPLAAAALLGGLVAVEDLGEAEVGGETLRHFRGVTDIAAAADAAPGRVGDQLAAAVGGFAETEVPFDAFLDDRGLPREITHRFRFGERGIDVTSTVELYDFGAPVDVVLPGDGEVFNGAVV